MRDVLGGLGLSLGGSKKKPVEADDNSSEDDEEEDGMDAVADDPEHKMQDFFDMVDLIRELTVSLDEDILKVTEKHHAVVHATGKQKIKDANTELSTCMATISEKTKDIKGMLKDMEQENKAYKSKYRHLTSNVRIRETQYSTLSRVFVARINKYNDLQTDNKKKVEKGIKTALLAVNPDVSEEDVQRVIKTGTQDIFSIKDLQIASSTQNEINHRHKQILQLEKSIIELHEMFLDMAVLVDAQGEMIDRIEFSVDQSQSFVEQVVKSTAEAKVAQSAARKKQVWIAICALVCLGLIVLTVVLGVVLTNKK